MVVTMQKIVGILGGMGPESTAVLLQKIMRLTPAAVEQDHLRIIVDSNPKIPNRTDALLFGNLKPVIDALCETAVCLERAGAEVIGMACNTAHAFLAEVRASVEVPVVDMIGETARQARQAFGKQTVVGILATDGTLRTRLYHEALEINHLEGVGPVGPGVQNAVMDTLDTVKLHGVSDESKGAISVAIRDVAAQGATALIAGCTEVALVLERYPPNLPWLDSLTVLADALVREATMDDPGTIV
jgi:aspartate racemase